MKKLFSLILLAACTTPPGPVSDTSSIFKHELEMYVESYTHIGVGNVVSDSKEIEIEIPAKKTKLITITSCHREQIYRGVNERKWSLFYNPRNGIEDKNYCPLDIKVFYESGHIAYGFLDFKYEKELTIPAKVSCNGKQRDTIGFSICQSRKGLIQRLKFSNNPHPKMQKGCKLDKGKLLGEYFIRPDKNKCVYLFQLSNGSRYRFVTLGYEEIVK